MQTLYDNHGRPLNYLRLAVTDRCNLRCFYCMPEEGIKYLPKSHLLSFEEITRLVSIFAQMGITKLRFTGGEPFLRNDFMQLVRKTVSIPGISEWHITTNGLLTKPHLHELKELGITSVNLSLDTLDRDRFKAIARRDEFDRCMETLHALLALQIPVKINCVVMNGKNTDDIIPLVLLTRDQPVSVRFIEEMPFNGSGVLNSDIPWTYNRIITHIRERFPTLEKIEDGPNSTSLNYSIAGHTGTVGVIPAFSRTFCGSCNRIRVTAQGMLKTCLYDDGVLDVRHLLRSVKDDEAVRAKLYEAFLQRPRDGFEAEHNRSNLPRVHESMSTIGG